MNPNIHKTKAGPELASAVSLFFVKDMARSLCAAPVATLRHPGKCVPILLRAGFGEAIVENLGEQARYAALAYRGA